MTRFLSIIPVFLLLLLNRVAAQVDFRWVDSVMLVADPLMSRKSYDSALVEFKKAEKWMIANKQEKDLRNIIIWNYLGDIYREKKEVDLSHLNYTKALQRSRERKILSETDRSLTGLFKLHRTISEENLNFNYPEVAETEISKVFFPILSFKTAGDSVDVIVAGGKWDGVFDSTSKVELFTHYSMVDTIYHKDINFYGDARVISIGPNHTLVRAKKHTSISLLANDMASIRTQVPLHWRKLVLKDYLANGLYLYSNYRQPLFHYRYFYYYADTLLEPDVFVSMDLSIKEVVDMYGEDTLTIPQFSKKNDAGIFAGQNVIRAMRDSRPEHIRLFLNYVNRYPMKYIGNNYKLAETYATWVINNTPLDSLDVKPFLESISSPELQRKMALNLKKDIIEKELVNLWLDEGLQQVNVENLSAAASTASLIENVMKALDLDHNIGWSDYLRGNIENNLGRYQEADMMLGMAAEKFRSASNVEGADWINNLREFWKKSGKINVAVQTGHILPYKFAQSVNARYFATGSADRTIKIWDRTLGKEVLTLEGHTDEINSLQYSPNGRYLVSCSEDKTICVWNAHTYTLLYRFKTNKPEKAVRFTPNSRYIVSAGTDSLIKVRELHTGKVIRTLAHHKGTVNDLAFDPTRSFLLYSASNDSLVCRWDINTGEMLRWYRSKGRSLSVKIAPNGKYMSVVSTDSLLTTWDLLSNSKYFFGKILINKPGNTDFYASESFTTDSRYIAYPIRKDTFVVIRMSDMKERVYPTNEKRNLCDLEFTNDGQAMLARFDLGGPLRIYNFVDWDMANRPTISYRDIHSYGSLALAVQFTRDDNGLVVLHSEVSKLDLQSGNNERLFFGFSTPLNPYLLLENENLATYMDDEKPAVSFYDYRTYDVKQRYVLADSTDPFSCWELSPGDQFCFIAGKRGTIGGFDIKSNKKLFERDYTTGNIEIDDLYFDKFRNLLFAVTRNDSLLVIEPLTGNIQNRIGGLKANYIISSPEYIYASSETGIVYKLDGKNYSIIKEIPVNPDKEGVYYTVISPDHRYLVAHTGFDAIAIIDLQKDSVSSYFTDHKSGGTHLTMSHDGTRFATTGFDSEVYLYETATAKKLVTVHYPNNRNVLISDEEGHYLASRHTLEAILLTYKNTAYSFDQFDVRLNRPDIILQKIGRADSSLLKTYHAAYLKRLKRMKLNEDDVGKEVHLPKARLKDRFNVSTVTTKDEYELTIECSDNRYDLQSLQVLVNNCPVYDLSGFDLRKLNTRSYTHRAKIPLSMGDNAIKIYCTNEKGTVSLYETFNIFSKYRPKNEPRVYFIGIGVANYKDPKMNLKYSTKDIRDLARTFEDLYVNITIDTLIDKKVTKDNIRELKERLKKVDINDRVILAVTGHGLLSDSLDFYYATWDVDFNQPEKKGVRYEELENLLTGIPARQKLLLIDACHSGALDKEELLAVQKDPTSGYITTLPQQDGVKGIAPRGFGVKNRKKQMSANSSFEMMQNLFTDLSSGNGAVVISAAGGMEYALEGGKWANGVFTYCVIKALNEKYTDLSAGNFDGKLSVQELSTFVSREVTRLTGGKQKPTSRRENIDYNWFLRVY